MNVFERQMEMYKNSQAVFEKYVTQTDKGIVLPDSIKENFEKTGNELLPTDTINHFLEIRSQYYANIINNKMKDYVYMEWVICLIEKVLLEYALPLFSRVLIFYPMLCGIFAEWEVLYEIAKIDEEFWDTHKEWKCFFVLLMKDIISKNKAFIKDEYLHEMSLFVKS